MNPEALNQLTKAIVFIVLAFIPGIGISYLQYRKEIIRDKWKNRNKGVSK